MREREDETCRFVRYCCLLWPSNVARGEMRWRFNPSGKCPNLATIRKSVWDCFARLNLVTPVLSPSSPYYPTRPDNDDRGVFQDAPSSCHSRSLRNFDVCSSAPRADLNDLTCRSLVTVCAGVLMWSRMILGGRRRGMCEMKGWAPLDAPRSLFASWAMWCIRIVDVSRDVGCLGRCACCFLMVCPVPCL